jgi:hypothetical protein
MHTERDASFHRATERGRTWLRRRRLVRAAGPAVLAVSAALAVVLTGAAASASNGHSRAPYGSRATIAPGAFNPAQLTIGFGWLPRGSVVSDGETSPGVESLGVSSPHRESWGLAVYGLNACHVTKIGRQFRCLKSVNSIDVNVASANPIAGRAPAIDGHRALWLAGPAAILVWERAPGEWAVLEHGSRAADTAKDVRVASEVKYGQQVPARYGQRAPLGFAARFTSLPSGWQLMRVYFGGGGHVLLGYSFAIGKVQRISATTQIPRDSAGLSAAPVISANRCVTGGRLVIIHGYRFRVLRAGSGKSAYEELCGDHVDGLLVTIGEAGAHPKLSVTQLMERLELLGPKPANWVTNPMP